MDINMDINEQQLQESVAIEHHRSLWQRVRNVVAIGAAAAISLGVAGVTSEAWADDPPPPDTTTTTFDTTTTVPQESTTTTEPETTTSAPPETTTPDTTVPDTTTSTPDTTVPETSTSTSTTTTTTIPPAPSTNCNDTPPMYDTIYRGKGPKVAFVGDSLMGVASPCIAAATNNKYSVSFMARSGRRIDEVQSNIDDLIYSNVTTKTLKKPSDLPKAIVLNLGANNMMQEWYNGNIETTISDIHAEAAKLQGLGICVVQTTLSTVSEQAYGKQPWATTINSEYEAEASTYSNFKIADWNAMSNAQPRLFLKDWYDVKSSDFLHFSNYGGTALANTYMDILQNQCNIQPK